MSHKDVKRTPSVRRKWTDYCIVNRYGGYVEGAISWNAPWTKKVALRELKAKYGKAYRIARITVEVLE